MILNCNKILAKINKIHVLLRTTPNIASYELCKLIIKLESIYEQYAYAMIIDDNITYACFFTSMDIMHEDLKHLKQYTNASKNNVSNRIRK